VLDATEEEHLLRRLLGKPRDAKKSRGVVFLQRSVQQFMKFLAEIQLNSPQWCISRQLHGGKFEFEMFPSKITTSAHPEVWCFC